MKTGKTHHLFRKCYRSLACWNRWLSTAASFSPAIRATTNWLEQVVVKQKLCPFASPFVKNPTLIRIVESRASNPEDASHDVTTQVRELMRNTSDDLSASSSSSPSRHETTLIAFSDPSFVERGYRDFVRLSWKLQEEAIGEEYLGKLQLVLFHPKATHQTYGDDDLAGDEMNAANYTIRSPFPTIHLLREVDVMRAVTGGYPDLDALPSRNKMKFIKEGAEVCKKRLEECLKYNA
jgi:hypothetical protein